jgi:nucleotide-binding universal stress UspA family protein
MFKNLLVHIPTERSARPAVDGSVSLALTTGAHLDAIAVGYESTNIPFVAEGGAAVASIYELEQERAMERAVAALNVFEAKAKPSGISYGCQAIAHPPAEAMSIVAATARLYDLTIVSQPEPDCITTDNRIPQEILFRSGGPVLFFPYTFRGSFEARRIGICWDGSRLAARALHDAMPFLVRARALKVISLKKPADEPVDPSPETLLVHLARARLSADIISFGADRSDIQSSILSVAADENLDLLVMGGYGHSHLQEVVLGGVTHSMFGAMTVPTLMSH